MGPWRPLWPTRGAGPRARLAPVRALRLWRLRCCRASSTAVSVAERNDTDEREHSCGLEVVRPCAARRVVMANLIEDGHRSRGGDASDSRETEKRACAGPPKACEGDDRGRAGDRGRPRRRQDHHRDGAARGGDKDAGEQAGRRLAGREGRSQDGRRVEYRCVNGPPVRVPRSRVRRDRAAGRLRHSLLGRVSSAAPKPAPDGPEGHETEQEAERQRAHPRRGRRGSRSAAARTRASRRSCRCAVA